MTNLMNKLFIALILLCPLTHAFDLNDIKALIAQANINRQTRIERVQNYLANQYDREEDQNFYDEPIVAPSLQTECYPVVIGVAACCVVIASMMYLQNQQQPCL